MEYDGMWWNMLEYAGMRWNVMEYKSSRLQGRDPGTFIAGPKNEVSQAHHEIWRGVE